MTDPTTPAVSDRRVVAAPLRWLLIAMVAGAVGCGRDQVGGGGREPHVERTATPGGPALLLAQAQFEESPDVTGEVKITPGAARLTIARFHRGAWTAEVIEDPDSNVFHKAMPFVVPGERPGILTIGANFVPAPALMKVWRRGREGWQGETIASADFGHRFNRFRDVEIGDVTGDGVPEIVLATHDQGVVAVVQRTVDRQWSMSVIDRSASTFVHEIELGDVDGDGVAEIFATPTEPNRIDRRRQPGRIVMYSFDGGGWTSSSVDAFEDRHAKEILVADLDRNGRPDLLAAVEPPASSDSGGPTAAGVTVTRYRRVGASWESKDVATIPAESCRFLRAGDVDGDRRLEVVAACGRSGLWVLRPGAEAWSAEQIDATSTAVELATALADLDRNGIAEIFVAAEDQARLRAYQWDGERFQRYDLMQIPSGDMSFGLEVCVDPACLGDV